MQVTALTAQALLSSVAVAAVASSDDISPNPATLFTRDTSGGDAVSCGGGYMPNNATCCSGSTYCESGDVCTKDGGCCPKGQTCTGVATSCEAGQKVCHDACVPEGADCCGANRFCPPDFYCGTGDQCFSNSASGSGGGAVSRGVVVAVAGAVGYWVSRR
ncbi:hypothetical protein B0J18DRAFT_273726 [Chaetomium sp. MPI-SDFR-AT-0129]|nr:hypothetical protein B0J18DRAFT_273726 [Chaetomium sp. MPI-SDFR-AT-0129]